MSADPAYDAYFSSGEYLRRYPRPRRHTLARVRDELQRLRSPVVLDFGAGAGRYTLALLRRGHDVIAVERCASGRAQLCALAERQGLTHRLSCVPDLASADIDRARPLLTLCLFGVMSYMTREERAHLLQHLRTATDATSHLVTSVPNGRVRFRREQRQAVAPSGGECRIHYTRRVCGTIHSFAYTLFTAATIEAELHANGWHTHELTADGILPERLVARSRVGGLVDAYVVSLVPASWGFGLLAVASPQPSRGSAG